MLCLCQFELLPHINFGWLWVVERFLIPLSNKICNCCSLPSQLAISSCWIPVLPVPPRLFCCWWFQWNKINLHFFLAVLPSLSHKFVEEKIFNNSNFISHIHGKPKRLHNYVSLFKSLISQHFQFPIQIFVRGYSRHSLISLINHEWKEHLKQPHTMVFNLCKTGCIQKQSMPKSTLWCSDKSAKRWNEGGVINKSACCTSSLQNGQEKRQDRKATNTTMAKLL